MLLATLRELELSLHGARRHDKNWLEVIFHPEFREITRSGKMIDRRMTIDSLLAEDAAPSIISEDYQLVEMGQGMAMLHYKTRASDGRYHALRTSIWVNDLGNKWTLFFHQGTAIGAASEA